MNGYDPSATGSDTHLSFDFWILGDPFLREYYTIHSMDWMAVGTVGFVIYDENAEKFDAPDLTSTSS